MIKQFDEFIKESYNNFGFVKSRLNYYMINESQESKSQSEAKKYIKNNNKFNWSESEIDDFIRVKLRNDITPLRDKQIAKFTLGVTRMYFNNEITDANTISKLNSTLKLLSAHLNEYDRNLNGLSADELISRFEQTRENNVKKEKNEINRMKFGVSDYEIVRIDSFSDAKKYYSYTNPHSRWCLTHMEKMFDSYTCDGINQIYFCLKNGFEDIKNVKGESAPLDEYGLSMLSIIVNEEGELAYCTTRWNHDNGGNDSAMNAVEISEVVNVNFYEIFKPNNKWKDILDNAKQRFANGESPEEIFDQVEEFNDGYTKVKLNKKYNIIKNRELLSDNWFDYIGNFYDGYAKVQLYAKGYNFINTEGNFLFDIWFDDISDFYDGCAGVSLEKKGVNFINKEGKLLLDEWCDGDVVNYIKKGFANISRHISGENSDEYEYNIINITNGKLLLDEWIVCHNFDIYFGRVGDYTKIAVEIKTNYKDGYDEDGYDEYEELETKCNLINKNGELLLDKWCDVIYSFNFDYAKARLRDRYNLINKEGKFVSDDWYDEVSYFKDGYAKVKLYGKGYNFINTEGKLMLDKYQSYDEVHNFINGYAMVRLYHKGFNFINTKGNLMSDEWFDWVDWDNGFKDGYVIVKSKDKGWNAINTECKPMSDEWFDSKEEVDDYLNSLI